MRQNLLAEIRNALGPAIAPSLSQASAASDIYEAYVFSLILRAARAEGASVTLKCINGGPPNPFVFRTSPGYISSRYRNYGYASIAFAKCPVLEAHVSVRVSGQSNVLHECDVSVLLESEADICRTNALRVAPRSAKVLIAVESKFYVSDLALHLGRGFLGLVNDFSASNTYFVINREAGSVERLLAHKRRSWDHNVVPTNAVPVARLTNMFQNDFKNFRAKTRT